jgi:serine/threonine protein kinase
MEQLECYAVHPDDHLEAGDMLDHYRLDARVARSGMATLYKATDLRDGRQVAIKVPHAEMEADPILVERFRREQQIGQELDHPGVVKTYDGGRAQPALHGDRVGGGAAAAGDSQRGAATVH